MTVKTDFSTLGEKPKGVGVKGPRKLELNRLVKLRVNSQTGQFSFTVPVGVARERGWEGGELFELVQEGTSLTFSQVRVERV